jgi:hypothetical protein
MVTIRIATGSNDQCIVVRLDLDIARTLVDDIAVIVGQLPIDRDRCPVIAPFAVRTPVFRFASHLRDSIGNVVGLDVTIDVRLIVSH